MAEKTEKLIADCERVQERVERAVQGATLAITELEKQVSRVEKLKDDTDQKLARKVQEEALTSRNLCGGTLTILQQALDDSAAPIKALASKVKTKAVLNVFTTQKSLEDAKQVLEDVKEACDAARIKLQEFEKGYSTLDQRVNDQANRMTLICQAQTIVEALAEVRKTLLPKAERVTKEVGQTIEPYRTDMERFEKEVETQAPWSVKARDKRVVEINELLQRLELQKKTLESAARKVTEALMPAQWDDYARVKKFAPVKTALAETQKLVDVLMEQIDKAHELIQEGQTTGDGVIFDMQGVKTTDGLPEEKQGAGNALKKSTERMERFVSVVVYGMDDFAGDVEELKKGAESLRKYLASPTSITATEWEQLEDRKLELNQQSRQLAQMFTAIKRAFVQAQKLQKQFPLNQELQETFTKMQQKFLEKGKHFKTFRESVKPMQEFLDKVLQMRPK